MNRVIENPASVKRADIVVGIPSYNEADSIGFVTSIVDEGLTKFFSRKECVIINVDNHSPDDTRRAFLETKTQMPKLYISTPKGIRGKGRNIKNLFEAGVEFGAQAIIMVDADLTSITPQWIKYLVDPIFLGHDYVIPIYVRHKYDGTITNNIAYPLTRVLYGLRTRQPIAGDFGFSVKLARAYLTEKTWDSNVSEFGIDIWMTTIAIARNFKVCQTFMGAPNKSDYQPANTILLLMKNILLNVNKYTNQNKIFLDQFIWFDNTPGFEKTTKIKENEIESFIHGSCSYLKNYTDGYGVWAYRDYIENTVYNPSFSMGITGWLTNGTTHLKENAIILEQDSSVSQKISKIVSTDKGPNTIVNVTFYAKSETPTAEIGIELSGIKFMKNITDSGSLYEFQLRTNDLNDVNITFSSLNGTTTLSDVKVYNYIHEGDVYNTNWEPLRSLKPIQQLNKCLS